MTEETSEETTEEPAAPQEEPQADSLAGKDFMALAAMAIPLECDITVEIEGQMTKSKMYMNGENEMRSEIAITQPAQCDKFLYIYKDDMVYMGCEGGNLFAGAEMFEDCDWLVFSESEGTMESGETTTTYQASTPEFEDVPSTQINCIPWVYDASKFDTPGKTCDMEELMSGYEFG